MQFNGNGITEMEWDGITEMEWNRINEIGMERIASGNETNEMEMNH
jgi:hypothetical protein